MAIRGDTNEPNSTENAMPLTEDEILKTQIQKAVERVTYVQSGRTSYDGPLMNLPPPGGVRLYSLAEIEAAFEVSSTNLAMGMEDIDLADWPSIRAALTGGE
jgi:hypothetical protein